MELGEEPNRYLTYAEVSDLIESWAQAGPQILQKGTYGEIEGYRNHYLRISQAVDDASASLPRVLIQASIHGDEQIAAATVLAVIHRMVEKYAIDDAVTRLIQTRDIYVIPVVSPASYDAKTRRVDGRDPNRTFPCPPKTDVVPTPSVANLKRFFVAKRFSAALDYHAFGRMVLHPWAYTSARFEEGDHGDKHRALAEKLGGLSGYRWGTLLELARYSAVGTGGDWFYLEGQRRGFHTISLVIEAGLSKNPPARAIPEEADRNYELLVAFVEHAPLLLAPDTQGTEAYRAVRHLPSPRYDTLSSYPVPDEE